MKTGRVLLVVVVLGGLFWAARQDGGVNGTFERAVGAVRDVLDDATTAGDTDAVVDYLQGRYAREGMYPVLSEAEQDAVSGADFTGIDYERCSPRYVVVAALSGRGTVSQLLVSGGDWGTVDQAAHCPLSLTDPVPWSRPAPDAG